MVLLRRVIAAIALVWLVLTLTFVLIRLAPGNPEQFLVSPTASAADLARARTQLGLDRSMPVQYARWAAATLRGDLGSSFASGQPVLSLLAEAAPVSIALGGISLALTFLIGVPVGMLQASRRGQSLDRVLTVVTTTVYAAPSFWLALALVAVFTYGAATLGLPPAARLPAFGIRTPGVELRGLASAIDLARHAVLPILILTAVGAAGIARYSRTSVLDLLRLDFVRAARAKGASTAALYGKHVLRNVTPSLVVLFALSLPGLLAGSIFVEQVFAWPGLGRATLTAILARDYPVVMGATLFYAAAVILANLAAELALPLLDPRRQAA